MKNEGLRNGIIELISAIILLLVLRVLRPGEKAVLLVWVIVGLIIFYEYKKNKKRKFPVIFYKPDERLSAEIIEYYEQTKRLLKLDNNKDNWVAFVVIPFYLIMVFVLFKATIDLGAFIFMPIVLLVILIIVVSGMIFTRLNNSRKIKQATSKDFLVANVEFYDSSYDHHGKTANTTYFVFVRKNGESMKLKVSSRVHNYVSSQQIGEGYLIKNQKGDGIYDVFDFIPVVKDLWNNEREGYEEDYSSGLL